MKPDKSSVLKAGFADGSVIHNRLYPKQHRFKYKMSWFLIDLDDIAAWAHLSWQYRYNAFSLFSLYDKDYISDEQHSIGIKLSNYLQAQQAQLHTGKTLLFTHPRFLGFGFNSVNFYFCYDDHELKYIVSEINNTPWGEKHLYLHNCDSAIKTPQNGYEFEFEKKFHISPFVDMNILYRWSFLIKDDKIVINMSLHQKNVKILHVHLDTLVTSNVENRTRDKYARFFQPCKMWLSIYWQAAKLWVKKVPFFTHPDKP